MTVMSIRPLNWINRFVAWYWLGLLASCAWITTVCWFASEDLGTPEPMQYALILLGFTLGLIVDDLCYMWRWHVACILHIEDVLDGVCPDQGGEITDSAVWRWYVKQGKPWWISSKRERPHVRFQDAWKRMEDYRRAMKRAVKNRGV